MAYGNQQTLRTPHTGAFESRKLTSKYFTKKGTPKTQAGAISCLKTKAEAELLCDLEILCFVVKKDEHISKDWSDDICDDILTSESLEPTSKGS